MDSTEPIINKVKKGHKQGTKFRNDATFKSIRSAYSRQGKGKEREKEVDAGLLV